jgi:hypothetical protein
MSKRNDYELLRIAALAGNQDAIDALSEIEQQKSSLESVDEAADFQRQVKKKLRARMATAEANRLFQEHQRRSGTASVVGQRILGNVATSATNAIVKQLPTPMQPVARQIAQNGLRMASDGTSGTRQPTRDYNATTPRLQRSSGLVGGAAKVMRLGCLTTAMLILLTVVAAIVNSGWFAAAF